MTIDLNDLRFELDRFAAGYSGTDPTILRAAKEYLRIVESAPDVQGADKLSGNSDVQAQIDLDCGDNSCRFATNRGGMRTNGGCRCFENAGFGPSAVGAALRMLPEIARLRAQLADVQAQIDAARAEEREACAQIVAAGWRLDVSSEDMASDLACQIRARSGAKVV